MYSCVQLNAFVILFVLVYFPASFLILERIISHIGSGWVRTNGMYLVKWRYLEYDKCTWESAYCIIHRAKANAQLRQ